jgi:hypothetical protein
MLYTQGSVIMQWNSNSAVYCYEPFAPGLTDTTDLGTPSLYWNDVYARNVVDVQQGTFTSIDSAAQWYTVAECSDHAMAIITVLGYDSGDHCGAKFVVSFHHGQGQITQIAGDTFSTYEFSTVRLYYLTSDRTNGGGRFAILLEPGATVYVHVEQYQRNNSYGNWTLYDTSSGDYGDQTGWTAFQTMSLVHETPLQTTGKATVMGDLVVGESAVKQLSWVESSISIVATETNGQAGLELTGNLTGSDGDVNVISFHNTQATQSDKRIAMITSRRYSDDDAGALKFLVSDASGNLDDLYFGQTTGHTWYINSVAEMVMTASTFRPATNLGLDLGTSSYYWDKIYLDEIWLTAQSTGDKSYNLVTDNGAGERVVLEAQASDIRFKINRKPITGATEMIMGLDGIYFEFNELGNKITGQRMGELRASVIAQDLLKVGYPAAVKEIAKTGYYDIDDRAVNALLVEGFKERGKKIEDLESELEKIKRHLNLN